MTLPTAIRATLQSLIETPDYDELVAVCEAIETTGDGSVFLSFLFSILERHPDFDFGTPGPIVHTIETFAPVYERHLTRSIRRRPVPHTLWMLNRIANVSIGEKWATCIALLEEVSGDDRWEGFVRDTARHCLKWQRTRLE